eukprot:COSAG02_NODE_10572_length_1910_cov_11.283723_1_plen_235_part_00
MREEVSGRCPMRKGVQRWGWVGGEGPRHQPDGHGPSFPQSRYLTTTATLPPSFPNQRARTAAGGSPSLHRSAASSASYRARCPAWTPTSSPRPSSLPCSPPPTSRGGLVVLYRYFDRYRISGKIDSQLFVCIYEKTRTILTDYKVFASTSSATLHCAFTRKVHVAHTARFPICLEMTVRECLNFTGFYLRTICPCISAGEMIAQDRNSHTNGQCLRAGAAAIRLISLSAPQFPH